jgi:hypothetical protein
VTRLYTRKFFTLFLWFELLSSEACVFRSLPEYQSTSALSQWPSTYEYPPQWEQRQLEHAYGPSHSLKVNPSDGNPNTQSASTMPVGRPSSYNPGSTYSTGNPNQGVHLSDGTNAKTTTPSNV